MPERKKKTFIQLRKSSCINSDRFGSFHNPTNHIGRKTISKVVIKMKEVLEMGLHMVIYPEGTRNKTNQPLQRFHDGAFRLSFDSGKSILAALIFNSAKALPRKFFFFWPSTIELHYLKAVSPQNFSSPEKLKEYVFDLMKEYYVSRLN